MGRYTLILAALGISIAGLDLSPTLLDRLAAFNAGKFAIELYRGDLDSPPQNLHGRFDVVMGFFVLHHVYDVGMAMRGVAQLLRPGGRAVFVEPNPLNPLYYVQILATPGMSWRAERGLLRMRPASMAGWLRDAGLSRFRTARFGFFPPFIANRPWARPIEGRLERLSILRSFLPFQLFLGQQP
jgi:SAM-dependent methyltransferase